MFVCARRERRRRFRAVNIDYLPSNIRGPGVARIRRCRSKYYSLTSGLYASNAKNFAKKGKGRDKLFRQSRGDSLFFFFYLKYN